MHTAPGGVTERLAEMVPALLEKLDEMTDRMVEVLVETEPPYREAMRGSLAAVLGVTAAAVGLKGTTSEGMGWEGRGEGISATAVCLLSREG